MHEQAATLLTTAARAGGIEPILALLSSQRFVEDIDRLGPTGTNALHIAVWRNNLALVEALLQAGASADILDKESGWSSLHKALYFGNLRIAAALLTGNASLTISDWRNRSPLDLLSQALACYIPSSGPGDVFSWGAGTNYALGTGSTEPQVAPARVDALHGKRVVSLSAAKFHSAAVTEDGALYTWGFGRGGRLGHPGAHLHSGESAVISPQLVEGLGKRQVVAVAAAKHHTLLCTSAGELWAMGSNRHGQLGLTSADTQPEPRRVGALRARVVAVAAANKHSVAVTAGGEIYTWGSNTLGQLGYGTFDSATSTAPRLVEALKGRVVVAAAAAKRHTLALTADGDVFTWGHRGVSPRRVQLAGARDATAADGRPLRFHRGHADVIRPEAVAICAGAAHSSALTTTGVVLTWRSADPALLVQEVGGDLAGKRVVSLSAGKYRTAVVTDVGDVYCWEGRSDFFPAEGRKSGSGSKKANFSSSGGAGGMNSAGKPILGRISSGVSGGILGASPDAGGLFPSSLAKHLSGSVGTDGGGSVGSWGSGSRPKHGASGSFLERVYSQKLGRGDGGGGGGLSTSLSARPETPRSAARAGTDAFEPIVPQKVLGLKRAGLVAVGEKHSLALQRWSVRQLEGLPTVQWLQSQSEWDAEESALEDDESSDVEIESNGGKSAQTSPLKINGLVLSSSPTGPKTASASLGPPSLQQCCEEAVARMLVDPRTTLQVLEYADLAGADLLKSYCLAVAVCNLDAVLVEARGAFEDLPPHLLVELEQVYKAQLRSTSSWKKGGKGGETQLSAACRKNLDAAIAAAGIDLLVGGTVELGENVELSAARAKAKGPRRRLQPGLRPTAPRAALGDLLDEEEDAAENEGRAFSGASTLSPPRLRGESSFKDLNTAAMEAAEQRLRRTLAKKIQQIEHLEAKEAAGAALDPQQRAKVAQRPVIASALAALDAGTNPEEVHAMLQAAAAAVAEQASTPAASGSSPPGYGTSASAVAGKSKSGAVEKQHMAKILESSPAASSRDGGEGSGSGASAAKSSKSRSRRRTSERSVLTAEASNATLDSGASTSSIPAALSSSFSNASAAVAAGVAASPPSSSVFPALAGSAAVPSPAKHVVGFATGSAGRPPVGGRSAEKLPPRKGALSMFLRGELDDPAGKKEKEKPKPAGPAWGGKSPAPAASTSLKQILNEQQAGTPSRPPTGPSSTTTSAAPTGASSSSAVKMPLASFLNPTSPLSIANKAPAWGGAVGSSPPSSHQKPSLRQIQEEQERRKASMAPPVWGASPPAAARTPSLLSNVASGAGSGGAALSAWAATRSAGAAAATAAIAGSSPGASTAMVLGTSPSGRAFFAAPTPQSKWYVPEEEEHEQRKLKSLKAIQTEESALKELRELYGNDNVRIAEDGSVILPDPSSVVADASSSTGPGGNMNKKGDRDGGGSRQRRRRHRPNKDKNKEEKSGGGGDGAGEGPVGEKQQAKPKQPKGDGSGGHAGGGGKAAGGKSRGPRKPNPNKKKAEVAQHAAAAAAAVQATSN